MGFPTTERAISPRAGRIDQLLTKSDIADLAKVRERTVSGWHQRGRMPAPVASIGKLLRWRRSDILAWLGMSDAEAGQVERRG
jgi:predicted DNA-binding transcriptional regulator AlpA